METEAVSVAGALLRGAAAAPAAGRLAVTLWWLHQPLIPWRLVQLDAGCLGCAESGSAIRVEKLGMRPGPLRVGDRVSCA